MKKILFIFSILLLPQASFAAFEGLVQIPGVESGDFNSFVNMLYATAISVAALIAIIKIIIAGAKYMMSDVVTNKQSAKTDIKWSLIGLLVIMGAVIVLELINPQLTKTNIAFKDLPEVPVPNPTMFLSGGGGARVGGPIAEPTKTESGELKSGLETAPLADYSVNPAFVKTEGNVKTYDIQGMCKNLVDTKYSTMSATVKDSQFKQCVNQETLHAKNYCEGNYGLYGPASSPTCKLPTFRRYSDQFPSEFEAYKASLPETSYAEKAATEPTTAQVEKFCKALVPPGIFLKFTTWRNVCVRYD